VIFFNVQEARDCLETHRIVFTLRKHRRRTGTDIAVKGSWYHHERIGRVRIKFVREVWQPEDLQPYVKLSGFQTAEEWFRVAKKMCKTLPMYLYRVELLPTL